MNVALCAAPTLQSKFEEWNEIPSYFRNPVDDFSSSIRPLGTEDRARLLSLWNSVLLPLKSSLIETELLVLKLGRNHLVVFICWIKKDSDSSSHSVKHVSLGLSLPGFSWHTISLSSFSVKQGDFINIEREWCQATGSYLFVNVGLNFRT